MDEKDRVPLSGAALSDLGWPGAFCAGAVILVIILIFFTPQKSVDSIASAPKPSLEESQKSMARAMCNQFILKSLNDPSSAQTGPLSDGFYGAWPAKKTGPDLIDVTARFRAKNGFGSLIVTQFKCVLRFNGEDVIGVETLIEQ